MLAAQGISADNATPAGPSGRIGATLDGRKEARLRATAQEFEATFLAMLLKEMRQTLDQDGLFPGDSGDVHGGLFDLLMGRHLADAGGVGLAAALAPQIRPHPVAPTHAPAAPPPHRLPPRPAG